MNKTIRLRLANKDDAEWLNKIMDKNWGGLPLVIRGKKYYPTSLDGIISENDKGIAGFLFYDIQGQDCEIIVFEVFDRF